MDTKTKDDEKTLMDISKAISFRVSELTAQSGEFYPFSEPHIDHFSKNLLPHQVTVLKAGLETPGFDITPIFKTWLLNHWENQAEKLAIAEIVDSEITVESHE